MSRSTVIKIGVGLFAWILFTSSTFVVQETEQVIITQFGEPRGNPVNTPGLHFKVPFIQRVNSFEKRFLEWDGSPN